MKITQSATATNQPEKNPQALFEIVEDVNLEKLVGGRSRSTMSSSLAIKPQVLQQMNLQL